MVLTDNMRDNFLCVLNVLCKTKQELLIHEVIVTVSEWDKKQFANKIFCFLSFVEKYVKLHLLTHSQGLNFFWENKL